MEKRRTESAGTFNVASARVEPGISHTTEPRLSKMPIVAEAARFVRRDTSLLFTYISLDASSSSPLVEAQFLKQFPVMADVLQRHLSC